MNGAEIGLHSSFICVSTAGTYDESKLALIVSLGDGLLAHVFASFVAGLASACVSTPADVVKTRFMNAAGSDQVGPHMIGSLLRQAYRGILHTSFSILRPGPDSPFPVESGSEGFLALYKDISLLL